MNDDARILAEAPIELALPDIDRVDPSRAALQVNVGEPAGRRADIDGDRPGDVEPERIESARQLVAPARDVLRAGIDRNVRILCHGRGRPVGAATIDPHRARQDEGLRALAARRELALHQQLVKAYPFCQ